MAMFGSGLRALLGGGQQMAPAAPVAQGGPRMFGGRMSLPEFIMLAGATAKDIGAGGGGSQNMAGALGLLEERRQQEAQAALNAEVAPYLSGEGGQGGASGIPPALLFRMAAQGHPGAKALLEMRGQDKPNIQIGPDGRAYDARDRAVAGQRFSNPTAVNDVILDLNDPANIERHVPQLGEGITFQRDASGRAIGAAPVAGYPGAKAAIEGASAQATERGKALGGLHTVPIDGGRSALMTGEQYLGGGSGGQGSVLPGLGRVGVTQSPAEAAADKALAEAGAAGQVDLGGALQTAQTALDVIEQIRMHPGRSAGTGVMGILPGIPGTSQRDFVALVDQAKGQVFLQAFESLKGGGQITEVEGRKATEAIARLDRAQSREGFEAALNDLESVIRSGMTRAQQRASQRPAQGATRGPGVTTQGQGFRILSVE